jgi:hypothetical protein
MTQIWGSRKEIAKLVAELGLNARVQEAEEPVSRKRGPGRPVKQPYKYARIAGYLLNHAGIRMECVNFGCRKHLRVNSGSICCSEACERELREYLGLVLDVLDGKMLPESFPMWARSKRASVRKRLREQEEVAASLDPTPPEPVVEKKRKNGNKTRRSSQTADGPAGHRALRFLPGPPGQVQPME